MSTNYHTPLSDGQSGNAATLNAPLGQLDSQVKSNADAIVAEAIARSGADTALGARVDATEADITQLEADIGAKTALATTTKTSAVEAINEVAASVVSETAARIAADTGLSANITASQAAATAAQSAATAVRVEVEAARGDHVSLDSRLDAMVTGNATITTLGGQATTTVSGAAFSGAGSLTLASATGIVAGMPCAYILSDGTTERNVIQGVSGSTITLDTVTAGDILAGALFYAYAPYLQDTLDSLDSMILGALATQVIGGASSATLRATPPTARRGALYAVVSAYTSSAELASVNASGALVPLTGSFSNTHGKGALVRFIEDGRLTVQMFGAAGDGATDDEAAIVAALAAATTGGLELHFPPGVYKIADASENHIIEIANQSKVALRGVRGQSVIQFATNYAGFGFLFEACDEVTAMGLTFEGGWDGTTGVTNSDFISLDLETTRASIAFCDFNNSASTAVIVRNEGRFSVDNNLLTDTTEMDFIMLGCRFTGNDMCFNTKGGGGRYGLVAHCHFDGNSATGNRGGLKIDGEINSGVASYANFAGQWIIDSCTFRGMGGTGEALVVEERAHEVIVSNCVIRDIRDIAVQIITGQTHQDCGRILFTDNILSNIAGDAIRLDNVATGTARTLHNITIHNNHFYSCDGINVYLQCSAGAGNVIRDVRITDNTFENWSQSGTDACIAQFGNGTYQDITIHNNQFSRPNVGSGWKEAVFFNVTSPAALTGLHITHNRFRTHDPAVSSNRLMLIVLASGENNVIAHNHFHGGNITLQGCTMALRGNRGVWYGKIEAQGATESTIEYAGANMHLSGSAYTLRCYNSSVIRMDNSNASVGVSATALPIKQDGTSTATLLNANSTGNRPTGLKPAGFRYDDTTEQHAIYWDGSNWRDGVGAID